MARRPPGFDLAAALRSVSFTPSVRDVPAVLELLAGDEDDAEIAERALLRMGPPVAARAALAALPGSSAPLRARLVHLLGRSFAAQGDEGLLVALTALALDEDPRARRLALAALGHASERHHAAAERALVAAWHREERVEHRRTIASALARVGGEAARALLAPVAAEDPELARLVAQTRIVLERHHTRATSGAASTVDAADAIDARVRPARALDVILRCRRGLEPLLVDELGDPRARLVGPGAVRLPLDAPLASLWRARTMLGFAFPLPDERRGSDEDLGAAVARAITSPAAREVFATFGRGAPRYRLEWAGGGKRRASVWRCVEAARARWPALINDPSRRGWEVVVRESGDRVNVELAPRLADPRFTYRVGDVPAASHPTVAAAIARLGGARPGDVVWDPFVGSGSELVERARLGPCSLLGSDRDPRALATARANLAAAGVTAELTVADALVHAPVGVTLILTNPPLGRRVLRHEDAIAVLERFVAHAARVLVDGGRLAWITPSPRRTDEAARRAGLRLVAAHAIDLGGFTGVLQLQEKNRLISN